MKNYKKLFKNKKITIMGLGILGRGLGYTKFLAECGADLIVTDLKTKEQLAVSIKALKKFKNIKFVLGEHRLEDFKGRDMVLKAAGVPIDSVYIKEAIKNNIPVEMDVSLFAKCVPGVMIIGVTGTRGKSMTTTLIYEILKANEKFFKYPSSKTLRTKKPSVFLGGNLRGLATLPLLKKIKTGDILVCELDSWQLQGFGDSKISPHISVFTTFMPDHMNYYKDSMEKYFEDKANIFKYQNQHDFLVIRPGMKKFINPVRNRPRKASATDTLGRPVSNGVKKTDTKGKLIIVNTKDISSWKFNVPGAHHRENLACAVEVAKLFKIPDISIKNFVKNFKGVEGRLQFLKEVNCLKIYNDNNATTPEATIAGIEALGINTKRKRIILVAGGADKGLDLDKLVKSINKYCKAVILIPGTGTDKLIKKHKLKIENEIGKDLRDIVKRSLKYAKKGDILLFSPAFASFGMFNNEYERNDQFIRIIKKLK